MKVTLIVFLAWLGMATHALAQTQGGSKLGTVTLTKSGGKRLALVIGNKNYDIKNGIRPLVNTERDVDSVTAALKKLGFDVFPYKNLDFVHTQEAIKKFTDKLISGQVDVAFVYFSGHGIGIGDVNYLLPIDTHIRCVDQLKSYESVSLNRLVDAVLAKDIRNNFFFLDACRSIGDLTHCDGTPVGSGFQGLAKPMEKYRHSLIAFATRAGTVADDDTYDKTNSLFTSELIKYLTIPDTGIRRILDFTQEGVFVRSGKTQDPKRWDDLVDDYVFIRTNRPPPPPPPAKKIAVIAYKQDNNSLDLGLAKLVVQELKQKFPDCDIQPQTSSKGLSNEEIVCTVKRKTSIGKNPIDVDNKTYDLIKADTDLVLTFRDGKGLLDEVELSEGGTDSRESVAIQNSIERALAKLKDALINLPIKKAQFSTSNPVKR